VYLYKLQVLTTVFGQANLTNEHSKFRSTILRNIIFAEVSFKLAALEILQTWNLRYRFAVLLQDKATLNANSYCTCSLARGTFWYCSGFRNKIKRLFPKESLTFRRNRMKTSLLASSPSSIKHLLPSRVKLALGRTIRLHSSTNSLKCAKLFDCYEYGLETQANRWQTWHGSNAEICLHAFPTSESLTAKKERRKKIVRLFFCKRQ